MPFRDLSSGSPHIGEAIRETVTSDLKELGALQVVERGRLHKVLAEQRLQAQQTDFDVTTLVRLGRVIGASLLVVGAYQKVPPQIRLTARIVSVETSEVLGTAKVDGSVRDFLRLQDRITAALLRSARLPLSAKRIEEETGKRPDLASFKAIELYGQAAASESDSDRRQLLQAAVSEDQNFSYATRDLDALEKRLGQYQAEAQPLLDTELQSLHKQWSEMADRTKAGPPMIQYLTKLSTLRRWHTLVREARAFLQQLPQGVPIPDDLGMVAWMLVQHDGSLKDHDAVLRDGEFWLRRAKAGSFSSYIQSTVTQTIERKRLLDENRRKLETDLQEKGKTERWDLCHVADLCRNAEQYAQAMRFYEACGQFGTKPWTEVYPLMLLTAQNGGLWESLHKSLAGWEKIDAREAQKWRVQNQGWFPEDK